MPNSDKASASVAWLAAKFPRCFVPDPERPHPLKIGIHKDLIAAGLCLSKGAIRRAMEFYCTREIYRDAILAGGARVDLNGDPAGDVTEGEQDAARHRWRPKKPQSAEQKPDAPKPRASLSDLRRAGQARKAGG